MCGSHGRVNITFWSSGIWRHVDWYVITNLKEFSASILAFFDSEEKRQQVRPLTSVVIYQSVCSNIPRVLNFKRHPCEDEDVLDQIFITEKQQLIGLGAVL